MSMMKFCRDNIKIIFTIIIICFLFSLLAGLGSYFVYEKNMNIAIIDGDKITRDIFDRTKDSIFSDYSDKGQNIDEKYLEERAFHTLAQEIIFYKTGKRIGEKVYKREILNYIINFPAFQREGKFDFNLYTRILNLNKERPFTFEKRIEKLILSEKMKAFISYGINVSDKEIDLEYEEYKDQIDKEEFKKAYLRNKQTLALKDWYESYLEKVKPKIYIDFNRNDEKINEKLDSNVD